MTTLNQLINRTTPRKVKLRRIHSPQLRGCPHKRAIVVQIRTVKPKKPNSAIRKIAKIRIPSTRKRTIAYIPGSGHTLQKYSVVLVRGGRVPDLPGVLYHLVRGALEFTPLENWVRVHRRSVYGVKKAGHFRAWNVTLR